MATTDLADQLAKIDMEHSQTNDSFDTEEGLQNPTIAQEEDDNVGRPVEDDNRAAADSDDEHYDSEDEDEEEWRKIKETAVNAMQVNLAEQHCAVCSKLGASNCAGCHAIKYCDFKCQRGDWPVHKSICHAFRSISARPSIKHRLVIVFKTEEGPPELHWVHSGPTPMHYDILAFFRRMWNRFYVPYNFRTKKEVSPAYYVYSESDALVDGVTRRDKSVQLATRDKSRHNVRGPIILCREAGENRGIGDVSDVTVGTYKDFIDNMVHGEGREVPVLRPVSETPASAFEGFVHSGLGIFPAINLTTLAAQSGAIHRDVED